MSESGTKIIAAGLMDEGIEFEKMEALILQLESLIESGKPVCPICKTIMVPKNYIGYYDKHSAWFCECDDFKGAEEIHGDYAC
jgi:hypothetical protein